METRWHWEWWFWGDNWQFELAVDLWDWRIGFEKGYGTFGINIPCVRITLSWPYDE